MPARLLMLAHAETSATRRAAFANGEPLEAKGTAALRSLAQVRCDTVLTSPAPAARETALALAAEPAIDDRLRDLDVGAWAGQTLADIAAKDPAGIAAFIGDPSFAGHDGETIEALITRVGALLDEWRGQKGRLVAITHAAVVRAAACVVLATPPQAFWRVDVAPLGGLSFSSDGRRWALRVDRE